MADVDTNWTQTGNDITGPGTGQIKNVADPSAAQDVATKTSSEAVVTEARVRTALAALSAATSINGQKLTSTQGGASGAAATITAPIGAAAGVSDQSIPAAGSTYTLDYAIAANSTVEIFVRATIVNTTDTHKRRIRYRILVARDAGAPTIEELTEVKTNDTAASIYVADISPVALYGAPSINGNNFRFTVTVHATKNQKVTVGLFPFVLPDPV